MKMLKSEFNSELYAQWAKECNATGDKTIVDQGDYYEVVPVVVDEEAEKAIRKQQIIREIKNLDSTLGELQGVATQAVSVDGQDYFDLVVGDELVTMTETKLNNYFEELSDKRDELIKEYKGL